MNKVAPVPNRRFSRNNNDKNPAQLTYFKSPSRLDIGKQLSRLQTSINASRLNVVAGQIIQQDTAKIMPLLETSYRADKVINFTERNKETVTVIGSGDLGRALVSCLVRAGFRAVVGSRNPAKARDRIRAVGGEVAQQAIALQESNLIMVAIPFEAYGELIAYSYYLNNKILIDVSNRPPNYDRSDLSMAQHLQERIPGATVVKALNTLSAYALQRGLVQGNTQVPVCGDSEDAKMNVMNLVRKLGYTPVDYGALATAKTVEDIPLSFFPNWKTAIAVALLIMILIWMIVFFRIQLCPNFRRAEGEPWKWNLFHSFPLKTFGNASAITSFNLLAACYFPGVLAAYIQLKNGTKYLEFPKWLDNWLKARKQLGLLALFLGAVHVICAIFITISIGMTVHWVQQTCMLFGGVSLGVMAILGITSLPSVSSTLTWKEFFFVQSFLGWMSLIAAFIHTVFAELNILFTSVFECTIIAHQVQYGIILPALTIFLKIPLLIPCVDSYLVKIRRGYDRPDQKYREQKNTAFVIEALP